MPEIECGSCHWQGKWSDVVHSVSDMDAVIEGRERRKDHCPKCYSEGLIDLDAVGPDDYEEQERNSSWK